ncbi:DNA-3-methyladenine glycosylase I [Immundisolibacter sp.]|uniref:DNA-3-methyladenine glycosylase I n=1 Tax=Immundisolibacter sp. TaxID=1934948 RepID=UPI0026283C5E|nr:DNA-3-methyladenine glycosylase I [Immundisolibacter sp.]MDD3652027.1 DNA-3-methyladenine glycosylase I [Immundisolibacter sp.]
MTDSRRCPWARRALEIAYHDAEWGVPQHDDRVLFEFLILEGAQAGLAWSTILNKRLAYRAAYCGFDAARVAAFDDADRARLLADAGIVRNRLKIDASIDNARAFLAVQAEHGSFDRYLWQWVDGRPIHNAWHTPDQVPARTALSDALSRDLKQRGFRFVGSTICYAYLQAVGLVNDHLQGCPRWAELAGAVQTAK